MGPACPRHCEGPRLFFLEGAHDWENVFVLCISHCLVLKQVLKEEKCVKLLGSILRRPTPSYIRSISELVIPRTVGKKHGYRPTTLLLILEHRATRLKCRWPRFPKNLQIKKIAFDIIKGLACPRHCEGPRLFFLEGAHDWANVFVLCIFHCLVFETGLERENAWNYWDIFYKDLLQVTFNIRTGNTKDGWKKHGINRQPFFWFGTPSNRITTKIPRESADQKDIVWYYHGSLHAQGYSSWREHMIERMCSCFAFPTAWFWNRSWKRKCVKLLGHILQRPTPSYIRYPNW